MIILRFKMENYVDRNGFLIFYGKSNRYILEFGSYRYQWLQETSSLIDDKIVFWKYFKYLMR